MLKKSYLSWISYLKLKSSSFNPYASPFNPVEKAVLIQPSRKSRSHSTQSKKPSPFNPFEKARLISYFLVSISNLTKDVNVLHLTERITHLVFVLRPDGTRKSNWYVVESHTAGAFSKRSAIPSMGRWYSHWQWLDGQRQISSGSSTSLLNIEKKNAFRIFKYPFDDSDNRAILFSNALLFASPFFFCFPFRVFNSNWRTFLINTEIVTRKWILDDLKENDENGELKDLKLRYSEDRVSFWFRRDLISRINLNEHRKESKRSDAQWQFRVHFSNKKSQVWMQVFNAASGQKPSALKIEGFSSTSLWSLR